MSRTDGYIPWSDHRVSCNFNFWPHSPPMQCGLGMRQTSSYMPNITVRVFWCCSGFELAGYLFFFSRCCGTCKDRALHAHWTAQSEFSELTLEKNVVKHHMPGTVQKALLTLQTQENLLTVED